MREILPTTLNGDDAGRLLCGFNVFGYEEALAVVQAAEALGAPTLLMVNRALAAHMSPSIIGPMLHSLAQQAHVPIGVHLDHAYDITIIQQALDSGFTSVMYDGSQLPLSENIRNTQRVSELTKAAGASLEGEVGTVPYSDLGEGHPQFTDPDQAGKFARETGVDALALSVGNIHRLEQKGQVDIDFDRLQEIENRTEIPLVIHGASGLSDSDLMQLCQTHVAKINVGTQLRQAYTLALKEYLRTHPQDFDPLRLRSATIPRVQMAAESILKICNWNELK